MMKLIDSIDSKDHLSEWGCGIIRGSNNRGGTKFSKVYLFCGSDRRSGWSSRLIIQNMTTFMAVPALYFRAINKFMTREFTILTKII